MIIAIIFCIIAFCNFGTSFAGNNNSIIENPRIIIIGAGAAGIAAASKLLQNGFKNIIILEAENRIGGRVYTTKFGNYSVDLGGQWVHGVKDNLAYELAAPFGLIEKSDTPLAGLSLKYFVSDGNLTDEAVEKSLADFYFKYVDEPDPDNITEYKSVGDFVEKMFDKEFKNDSKLYAGKNKYLNHFDVFRNSLESSMTWYDVSLEDGGWRDCEGDQGINWKTRGYSTILDILMKRIPDPQQELPIMNNTILNSEVKTIDYSSGTSESKKSSVLINTTNGQLYEADHVIVTVSLGVLKEKHKSLFIPALPERKVKIIENLGFGNVAKIYVLFDKPFWNLTNVTDLIFSFVWNDEDVNLIKKNTEKSWLLGMSCAMTVEHKPNLLELWVTGKSARAMEELPEDKVFNHTVENLNRFLGKKYVISQPLGILRTQWYSNPHFRGTYSFISIDAQKEKAYPAMLEEPVNLQNLALLFAGEATSKNRSSTVDGAIGSGWTAANRLINHYKNVLKFNE